MKITRKAGRQEMNRQQRKKKSKQQEITRQTSPDRIQRRNDAADSLRAAVITAYESGGLGK